MAARKIKRYAGMAAIGLLLNSAGAYALAVSHGYLPKPQFAERVVGLMDDALEYMGIRPNAGARDAEIQITEEAEPGAVDAWVSDIATAGGIGEDPEPIHIPTALPRPRELKTFAFEVTGEEREDVVSGYVLGEEGVSDDMRRAWEVLERARRDNGDPGKAADPEVFNRAAGEIGYVPSGVRPETIRAVDAEIGSAGHEVIRGIFEPMSADTGEIDGVLIRLQGVRAPRQGDTCLNAAGSVYDCSGWALNGLATILADRDLACEVMDPEVAEDGEEAEARDDARIGWCSMEMRNGMRRDVGEIAVQAGIASVEDTGGMISPYSRAQSEAKDAKNGIWSGSFVPEISKDN
ncbi:hypothetical protein [Paracoccus sp. ME4]|uniref:hypothetical protein n=1 Tax=Paracoccus sp. ME4 TaxID=3138066 RepID=UPI00398B8E51